MSTLVEQIKKLNNQIELSQQSDKAHHIIGEVTYIYEFLNKPQQKLSKLLKQFDALINLPDTAINEVSVTDAVKNLARSNLSILADFTNRWEVEGHLARQGNELVAVDNSLNGFAAILNDDISNCWSDWLQQLQSSIVLEDVLLETQKNIPGLESVYANYKNNKIKLGELTKNIPEDAIAIRQIALLSEEMAKQIGMMDFNLPEEVSTFFKHLNNPIHLGKVPVSMLTPEVISWLKEHKIIDQFAVERWRNRNS